MPPVVADAEVNRPAETVFAYATDPTRFSEWQNGVVGGRMDTDGGSGEGARCVTVRRIGGAERASTSELVHRDPPRTWSVRGIDGPIRAAVDVTVQPLGPDRSHLIIAVDFAGHGIGKLLVPLAVRRQARKEMPGNLARLKQQLENRRQVQERLLLQCRPPGGSHGLSADARPLSDARMVVCRGAGTRRSC